MEKSANFNLFDKNSIILNIGDIKLSDTGDTFEKEKLIKEYEYKPLSNPRDSIFGKQIIASIAYGDAKYGVSISDGKNSIILVYGANRISSNAQNIAIGYFNGSQYFFMVEAFGDIYAEKRGERPEFIRRRIVTCKSLWNHNEIEKCILDNGEIEEKPTEQELNNFKELVSKIKILEPALKKENMNALRKNRNKDIER